MVKLNSIAQIVPIYFNHAAISNVGMSMHRLDKKLNPRSPFIVDLFTDDFSDDILSMLAYDIPKSSFKPSFISLFNKFLYINNKLAYAKFYLKNHKHYKQKKALNALKAADLRIWHNPMHMLSWWLVQKNDAIMWHNISYPYLEFDEYANQAAIEITHLKIYNDLNITWITPSQFDLRSLINYGVNPEKNFILPLYHKYNLPLTLHQAKEPNLITFSRYATNKMHPELAKFCNESNINLTIFGDSDTSPEYAKQYKFTKQYESEKVKVLPKQDTKSFDSLLKNSNIFISNSMHEGFGMPIIEAEANSLPVLARRGTAMDELIKDGYNGYLFEELDEVPDLSDKIMKDYRRFSQNAYKHSQDYTIEKFNIRYKHILDKFSKFNR